MSSFARLAFGISPSATSFERRRFRGGAAGGRERIELIGRTFSHGFHAALEQPNPAAIAVRLEAVSLPMRGFACEGAAMGLALWDWLTPWRRGRTAAFLDGPAAQHMYMVHVGVGWLMAKLPCRLESILPQVDPVMRWLAYDGWGFHDGYFKWPHYLGGKPPPNKLKGYARRAFDQGFGRSLWFIDGAEVDRIPRTIATLAEDRHPDLWSGVGLAATYAGEVSEAKLEQLFIAAGAYQPQLAQGAAFAAKARQLAGNVVEHTERACGVFCGMSVQEAALETDIALAGLSAEAHRGREPSGDLDDSVPAYEMWRQRLHQRFSTPSLMSTQ